MNIKQLKQYKIWIIIFTVLCLSVTGLFIGQKFLFGHTEKKTAVETPTPTPAPIPTPEEKAPVEEKQTEKYYGFLMLGSDNGIHVGSDYTDSITYVAYSPEKNKAYAIPIYRDSLISLTCGGEKNINHVYQDNGPDCLRQSVAKMLNMPVDYYIYTSADAFVRVVDRIGGLNIIPRETFCSSSSFIKGKKYCVTAGETYKMDGNMLLSYTRDRNHGSGVPRANRHQDVLASFTRACVSNLEGCAQGVSLEIASKKISHNLGIIELASLQQSIFKPTTTFEFVRMDAIKGNNYADAAGAWHMAIQTADVESKRSQVHADFGERKI